MLRSIIDDALKYGLFSAFVGRLEESGVELILRPTSFPVKMIVGVSFRYKGALYSGGDLGRKYTAPSLFSRGLRVDYLSDQELLHNLSMKAVLESQANDMRLLDKEHNFAGLGEIPFRQYFEIDLMARSQENRIFIKMKSEFNDFEFLASELRIGTVRPARLFLEKIDIDDFSISFRKEKNGDIFVTPSMGKEFRIECDEDLGKMIPHKSDQIKKLMRGEFESAVSRVSQSVISLYENEELTKINRKISSLNGISLSPVVTLEKICE